MLEVERPASSSADSMDCGTHRTANRKTSFPFIWIKEKDDFLGGKSGAPLLFKSASAPSSLATAFRCLQLSRKTKDNR